MHQHVQHDGHLPPAGQGWGNRPIGVAGGLCGEDGAGIAPPLAFLAGTLRLLVHAVIRAVPTGRAAPAGRAERRMDAAEHARHQSASVGSGADAEGTGCSSMRPIRSSDAASAAVVSGRGAHSTGGSTIPALLLIGRPRRFTEQPLPLGGRPTGGLHHVRRDAVRSWTRTQRSTNPFLHDASSVGSPHQPTGRPSDRPAPTGTVSTSTSPCSRTAASWGRSPRPAYTTLCASPRHCPSTCTSNRPAADRHSRRCRPARPCHPGRPDPADRRPPVNPRRRAPPYCPVNRSGPERPELLKGQVSLRRPAGQQARGSAPAPRRAPTATAQPSTGPVRPACRRGISPAGAAPAHPRPAWPPRHRAGSPPWPAGPRGATRARSG